MKHGDIIAKFVLSGEPSRVFRFWRAALQAAEPITASVDILKRQPGLRDESPYRAGFHAVTKGERKLADISLSAVAERLGADEIADTRQLHDMLWAWLSSLGTRKIPTLDAEMPYMKVTVAFEGEASMVLDQLETLTNLEILQRASFTLVYLQDRPRVPKPRDLPPISGTGEAPRILESIKVFGRELAEGQQDHLRDLLMRIDRLFQRKAEGRLQLLRHLARGAFGHRAESWLATRDRWNPAPIQSIEGYGFEMHVRYLRHVISQAAKKSKATAAVSRRPRQQRSA